MDCRQCTENLTAYLDGELSAADSAQMRSHLEICDSCTAELRGIRGGGRLWSNPTFGNWKSGPNPGMRFTTASTPFVLIPRLVFLCRKWVETLAAAAVLVAICAWISLVSAHREKKSRRLHFTVCQIQGSRIPRANDALLRTQSL